MYVSINVCAVILYTHRYIQYEIGKPLYFEISIVFESYPALP